MKKLLHFSLEDLYILILLDEGCTTGQAGKKLFITQPAVSQRLKRFETFFDIKLHDKMGRGIGLNVEGKRMAKAAREAMKILEEAVPGYSPVTPKPQPISTSTPFFI